MNKSYISPSKLSCLAIVCMISCINNAFSTFVLSIAVAAVFLLAIVVVSFFEKITNSHVRFVIFAVISSGVFTILKLVFNFVGNLEFIEIAGMLDFALLACLVLGIYPIYYLHKTTSKTYYLSIVITSLVFVLFATIASIIVEVLAHGSLFGVIFFETPFILLNSNFIVFVVLSVFAVIGIGTELHIEHKIRENRLLVDKYKYLIRESQVEKLKKQTEQSKSEVFNIGGEE